MLIISSSGRDVGNRNEGSRAELWDTKGYKSGEKLPQAVVAAWTKPLFNSQSMGSAAWEPCWSQLAAEPS